MIDYKDELSEIIFSKVGEKTGLSIDEIKDLIEIPADRSMGDYAFPCFRLAKEMKKSPTLIASEIAETIASFGIIRESIAVNAYVNFMLDRETFIADTLGTIAADSVNYGRSRVGCGKKVIVEFSSPNIAKPFHIGHIRSTVIGNSINKIYNFLGYDVERINHLGDYGTQFGKMICAYRHWGNEDDVKRDPINTLLSYYTKFHEEEELHPELADEARDIFARLESGEPEEVKLWQWFRDESLNEFRRVYDLLGVEFDSYAGESFYSDKMQSVLDELDDKQLLLDSEGAKIVDLEEYNMAPALIKKSNGSTLYITRDIAAAIYRKKHYDFYKNLYVVASQQNLHFAQWIKVLELLGYDWATDCVHIPFGLVSLEDGTMSTRHGRVVFLKDVLNKAIERTREIIIEKQVNTDDIDDTARKVGIGAVIFQELSNNRIKDYVFSWDKVLNFDGETGPYVQYTYARAKSVLRKAGADTQICTHDCDGVDFSRLTGDRAYDLIRLLYGFPEIISDAGDKYEPSIITRYIADIAKAFNKFYHDEHVLVDDEAERKAKLLLVKASATVIKIGLSLLAIETVEKM